MNQFDFDRLAVEATLRVQQTMTAFIQAWFTRPATEPQPPVLQFSGKEGQDGKEETIYRAGGR